jgi:DNA invertase Pin-like site-specific DNA recombinase
MPLIGKRCLAGIERAGAKGKKFGRPVKLDTGERRKIAERYAAGETMEVLARDSAATQQSGVFSLVRNACL